MPSVRYYNQTAPFWDFVANLESQSRGHPFFGHRGESDSENEHSGGWPFGPMPHRGHHGRPGPPPPPPEGPADPNAPPPPSEKEEAGPSDRGHGAFRGRHSRRGGCNGRRGFPYGAPPSGGPWEFMRSQFFGDDTREKSDDFKPEADVFDTAESFVVHVALPGAKKEDVGVNWDAEKSELSIAGVVYRPGDEDFLKTLALDERRVGPFEKKIRLGSRASPAQVDVDAITAKMEDGVLTIDVPKLDAGYVEVKKVDIE